MAITSAQVQQLYVAYLGRAADKAGIDYWLNELNASPAKMTLENLRANIVNEQPEYKAIYGGLTREETVIKVYNNLFGRAPDAEGLAYWTTGGGASVNPDQLLVAFVNGASATDAKIVANKVLVAEVYTSTAGDNATTADAAAVISGVTDDYATVTAALGKLESGELSGLALPVGLAQVKAAALAAAAQTANETAQIKDLLQLNKDVIALDAKYDIAGTPAPIAADADYATAHAAVNAATALRTAISPSDTKTLTTAATDAAADLAADRQAVVTKEVGGLDLVKAYEAAVAKDAATTKPADATIAEAVGTLQATVAAKPADWAAANAANGTTYTTAQDLYDALTGGTLTSAQVAKIVASYGSVGNFTAVKSLADQVNAKTASEKAVTDAAAKLVALDTANADGDVATNYGQDYLDSVAANTAAQKVLAQAKEADALVAKAAALDAAHDALVKASDAADALVPAYASNLSAAQTATVADKSDLFYFGSAIDTTDQAITGFAKGDALYVGEGLVFNKGALTAGDNNTKEFFLVQGDTGVQVVIETSKFGSASAVENATTHVVTASPDAAVITLTGLTLDQVAVNNGVISYVA